MNKRLFFKYLFFSLCFYLFSIGLLLGFFISGSFFFRYIITILLSILLFIFGIYICILMIMEYKKLIKAKKNKNKWFREYSTNLYYSKIESYFFTILLMIYIIIILYWTYNLIKEKTLNNIIIEIFIFGIICFNIGLIIPSSKNIIKIYKNGIGLYKLFNETIFESKIIKKIVIERNFLILILENNEKIKKEIDRIDYNELKTIFMKRFPEKIECYDIIT